MRRTQSGCLRKLDRYPRDINKMHKINAKVINSSISLGTVSAGSGSKARDTREMPSCIAAAARANNGPASSIDYAHTLMQGDQRWRPMMKLLE